MKLNNASTLEVSLPQADRANHERGPAVAVHVDHGQGHAQSAPKVATHYRHRGRVKCGLALGCAREEDSAPSTLLVMGGSRDELRRTIAVRITSSQARSSQVFCIK